MQTLSLSPLPFDHSEESRSHRLLRSGGFVDEEVVSGLIAHGLYERAFAQPEDMVLSSSEDDYAGWDLPATPGKATIAPPNFYVAWRENSLVTSASPG